MLTHLSSCVSLQCIVKTVHSQPSSGKATYSEGVCSIEVGWGTMVWSHMAVTASVLSC